MVFLVIKVRANVVYQVRLYDSGTVQVIKEAKVREGELLTKVDSAFRSIDLYFNGIILSLCQW